MRQGGVQGEDHDRNDNLDHTDPGPQVAALLARARSGDRAAWDGIVERYSGPVWAVIGSHGLAAADAADVSQVTWLLLVQHLDRLESDRLGRWLAATATREAVKMRLLRGPQSRDEVADYAVSRCGGWR
jgi:DNA-directed RNA polymerase specialized sigma24 family protein